MNKVQLERLTQACVEETRAALQLVYDSLNQGQQNKLLKEEAVAELFERYGVKY